MLGWHDNACVCVRVPSIKWCASAGSRANRSEFIWCPYIRACVVNNGMWQQPQTIYPRIDHSNYLAEYNWLPKLPLYFYLLGIHRHNCSGSHLSIDPRQEVSTAFGNWEQVECSRPCVLSKQKVQLNQYEQNIWPMCRSDGAMAPKASPLPASPPSIKRIDRSIPPCAQSIVDTLCTRQIPTNQYTLNKKAGFKGFLRKWSDADVNQSQ
jgi:hypothetical protein